MEPQSPPSLLRYGLRNHLHEPRESSGHEKGLRGIPKMQKLHSAESSCAQDLIMWID
jgi:hypothetical protein